MAIRGLLGFAQTLLGEAVIIVAHFGELLTGRAGEADLLGRAAPAVPIGNWDRSGASRGLDHMPR